AGERTKVIGGRIDFAVGGRSESMGETYPGHLAGVVDAESLNEAPQEGTRDEGADVIRASIDGAVGGGSESVGCHTRQATIADHLARVVDAHGHAEPRSEQGAQVVGYRVD